MFTRQCVQLVEYLTVVTVSRTQLAYVVQVVLQHECVCVCAYVIVCVCVCACVRACMHLCMHVCTCIFFSYNYIVGVNTLALLHIV